MNKLKCLLFATLAVLVLMPAVVFAAPVVKEGLSYSVPDCNFEQVTLLELWKKERISVNTGFRSNDTVLADLGYDLGAFVQPAKSWVAKTAILKPLAPILDLVNPSIDIYAGFKVLRDNMELVLNRAECDYGISIVALSLRW